jgi:tRNA nucleotidyltransferase/poly(A) polymerase
VYLVGGCVRDLIMKKTPKDFDIITTADLRQVITQINNDVIMM